MWHAVSGKAGELASFGSHDPESDWEIWKRVEVEKRKALLDKEGYSIEKTKEDGNCLFRAVARQIYGNSEEYQKVRMKLLDTS